MRGTDHNDHNDQVDDYNESEEGSGPGAFGDRVFWFMRVLTSLLPNRNFTVHDGLLGSSGQEPN